MDQRREEEKADHVTEYGREDSGNHDGEHERFLDESDQAGVGVRSHSRGSSASQVRRSRSRVRSRSRSQARSRSWSRSRSRSRSGPTITISDLNNGRAEGESNGKDLEELAELLAENERLEKMLHGSTPGGGETAPVLKGVGGNSGGYWLLEGACQAGRCLPCFPRFYFALGSFVAFDTCYRVQPKNRTKSRQIRWKTPFSGGVEVMIQATPNARAGRSKPPVSLRQVVCRLCLQKSGPYHVSGRCALSESGEMQLELVSKNDKRHACLLTSLC